MGVILVFGAMARSVIRIEIVIVIVMAVPVIELVRETCGRKAVDDLSRSNLMHRRGRAQERQRAQHHRDGDDETKTVQECRSRHVGVLGIAGLIGVNRPTGRDTVS